MEELQHEKESETDFSESNETSFNDSKEESEKDSDSEYSSSSGTTSSSSGSWKIEKTRTFDQDAFKNFDKNGKNEFFNFVKEAIKDKERLFEEDGTECHNVYKAILDLIWNGVRSGIKKEVVISTLAEIANWHPDLPAVILDNFNGIDLETSVSADELQEERAMFLGILKDAAKFLDESLIKERIEIDTLQELGLVKNKVFYTKFIKIKTKLYYKQRRYNLFREESEGYAKLTTELNHEIDEEEEEEEEIKNTSKMMNKIMSLIGCFNLDPNRVLDIILESFEVCPEREIIFIPLIREYMPNSNIICEVLGYKLSNFANSEPMPSLLRLCSLLLKNRVINMENLYDWLSPSDNTIASDWQEHLNEAKEILRRLNVITLSKDKDVSEPEPLKLFDKEKYLCNQKLGLCEALLNIGDWENAEKIIKKLPDQCVVSQTPIAFALIRLLNTAIDDLFIIKPAENGEEQEPLHNFEVREKLEIKDYVKLRSHVIPMLISLGQSLHHDSKLMYKVVRLLRSIITNMGVDTLNGPPLNTESESQYYEVLTVLDTSILPSLSFLDCNCPMAEEIWTVMKMFPYYLRYSLYARWKNDTYLLHPLSIMRRAEATKQSKALMKRVSKENVKPIGRQFGKFCHSVPGFFMDYVLVQIQSYENLIAPVVDSLKYLTSLSFDCLGYCLIEALARGDRDRIKHDGTSISMWLQNLASFAGAVFKKYNIELSGLLQYVANQLKSQKSLDLLILREIVQRMTGVENAEEMTNEQLNAMCGGELLRGEAGYFSQVRNTKKSSLRLKEALASNDLAVTLCLLMAQQKHCVIYKETAQSHLKLVGKLYDQCQDTLVQFGTFLGSTYSVDEYVERLPSIIAMLREYHINADVAFFLARPMFTHQINQKYDQLRKADPNAKKLTGIQKLQKYLAATQHIMDPIVESVRPLHGPKIWEDISPHFFVTFWSLSMYDLQVPVDMYQKEIAKLKQLSMQIVDTKDSNASKNKKEQDRYIALMDKLQDERKKQQEHVDKILQRLHQQKDCWFFTRSAKSAKNETITQFLQLCLFPRCTFTALDALYCAKFVYTIHILKAANFSTLLCYDRIFCDISYCVTSCTENEATRYGRFLCTLLDTVMRWHSDQAIFNKECANYPGFVTKFRVSNQFSEANDHVGYENYRHVCHKWHFKITKSLVCCLESKEFIQIRNAIIILMRILPHFPLLAKLSSIIERKVDIVRENEKNKRPDLFVIASSYIAQLRNRAPQLIKESDFHQVTGPIIKPAESTLSSDVNNSTENLGTSSDTQTAKPTTVQISVTLPSQKASSPSNPKEERQIIKVISNGDAKTEKDRMEKTIKITTATVERSLSKPGQRSSPAIEEKEDSFVPEYVANAERDYERQRLSDKSRDRSAKRLRSHERERDRESREQRERGNREREYREDWDQLSSITGGLSIDKNERRRSSSEIESRGNRESRGRERDNRALERDLSSVSNESNSSSHRRVTQEQSDMDKESKRRKIEHPLSQPLKKHSAEDSSEITKKDRSMRNKERKEKLTEEERDARRERKLGRKRERMEEIGSSEHKRRRDVINGEDEIRERDKYHSREKSPYIREGRERSHEKFERDRSNREYGSSKSTRSRIGY